MCLLDLKGPQDELAGPRRARDHDVHVAPSQTARTHPERSQPRSTRRTTGCSKLYCSPASISKAITP